MTRALLPKEHQIFLMSPGFSPQNVTQVYVCHSKTLLPSIARRLLSLKLTKKSYILDCPLYLLQSEENGNGIKRIYQYGHDPRLLPVLLEDQEEEKLVSIWLHTA